MFVKGVLSLQYELQAFISTLFMGWLKDASYNKTQSVSLIRAYLEKDVRTLCASYTASFLLIKRASCRKHRLTLRHINDLIGVQFCCK